ncbi:Calcium-binding EF-hand-containing protein [Tolumonas auensis DSM 9187]|uniref:Calcium-binding EF-hand-containing protein n=1 Tax=Tolumonas auensis (strain DSM 9187 / NBRC 110442 / TA 4) TaxID=595494 RepID=C4L960_TOLAT|nr:calcium-binding domain-containing protein [Tolumonas auensis]ACQ91959.1 Calcium-binding EF-hand-containing protein [Tolumonas auensis DSM 9187]
MKVMGAALLVTFLCAPVYATEVTQTKSVPVQADNLFTKADKDQDGKLDQKEFAAFKQLQEERMIRQIKQRMSKMQFSAFDKDGDSEVTQDELKSARIEARQKMMQQLRERQLQLKPVVSTAVDSAKK